MHTPGRNDPCLCGSGKKFKKCCEFKKKNKKIQAQVITPSPASNLSAFFQKKVLTPMQEGEGSQGREITENREITGEPQK